MNYHIQELQTKGRICTVTNKIFKFQLSTRISFVEHTKGQPKVEIMDLLSPQKKYLIMSSTHQSLPTSKLDICRTITFKIDKPT